MRKVLISSFAVSPNQGSEGGLGWDFTSRVGKFCDATILYGSEKRSFERDYSIDKYLAENGEIPNVKFVWVEPSKSAKKLLKLHDKTGLDFLYYKAYKSWQKSAFKIAKQLDAKENFDLIHQYNMLGFREPGFLWKMDKPFIWGPVAGTINIKFKFFPLLGISGFFRNILRNTANVLQLRFSNRVNNAGRKAFQIIAASTPDRLNLKKRFSESKIVVINDIGTKFWLSGKIVNKHQPLRIVWSGVHIPRKAMPLLLKSLNLVKNKIDFHLIVLGKGKETQRWKRMADEYGLTDSINWVGQVDRKEAMEIMKKSDITAVTSLNEATSTVVLESISLGLPVLCLDICGMGDVINSSCGIKIPAHNINQIIKGFADAIQLLDQDRNLLEKLSQGALHRATQCSWDDKALAIVNAYPEAGHTAGIEL